MFNISLSELFLVFVVGSLFLTPKDLVILFQKIQYFNKILNSKIDIVEDFLDLKYFDLFNNQNNSRNKKNQEVDRK